VTLDGLPFAVEPPITEAVRQGGIDFLQRAFANNKMDLEHFQKALDEMLAARTEGDFVSVVRALPPPVEFTLPSRRHDEPIQIAMSLGHVRLDGRWQVGRVTTVTSEMGHVFIDLCEAEFDDWEVELVIQVAMGNITVIVPRGLDVRLVGRNSTVNSTLEPPIPGFPVVRLSATSDVGTISLAHPVEKRSRRRRWRKRPQPTLGP
jgi:hypothetical protein